MPKGRPAISGARKFDRLAVAVTASEKAELDAAAEKIGKPTSTWARDELLRLAREINGPAVKKKAATPAKKPAKRKTAGG